MPKSPDEYAASLGLTNLAPENPHWKTQRERQIDFANRAKSVVGGITPGMMAEQLTSETPGEYVSPQEAKSRKESSEQAQEGGYFGMTGIAKFSPVRHVADEYMKSIGKNLVHDIKAPHSPELGVKVAKAYEEMPHNPNDPAVQKAYQSLIDETKAQYQAIKKSGLQVEPIQPGQENPYKSSHDMIQDVNNNNHLYYFPTEQGFGGELGTPDHPLMRPSGESINGKEVPVNDIFRITHDYFGHAKEGNQFGPKGEEKAYVYHSQMYSPEAQKALATETRGQNSYVNYGPNAEHNKLNPNDTKYAEQKAGILPDWAIKTEGVKELKHVEPTNMSKAQKYKRELKENAIDKATEKAQDIYKDLTDTDDDNLNVFHIGKENLTHLDPSQQGTGADVQKFMKTGKPTTPYSSAYVEGSTPEPNVLAGSGSTRYDFTVPKSKLYNISEDPNNYLGQAAKDFPTGNYEGSPIDFQDLARTRIKQAGHEGLLRTEGASDKGSVELFNKTPLTKPENFAEGGMAGNMNFDSMVDDSAQQQPMQQPEHQGMNFDSLVDDEEKFGGPKQQLITALEGAGRGLVGPLATMAEVHAGVPRENILGREHTNPVIAGAGEAGGLGLGLMTGTGEAKLMTKAGELANTAMGLHKASTLGGKIASSAAKQAAEMLVLQGGDELSKTILKDPEASAQNAIANMGLAAALGGVTGAAIGSINPLWKATVGNKLSPLLADMKGRINFRVDNPELPEALTKELQDMHQNVSGAISDLYSDDVIGGGVKSFQIAKAMPEMSEKATSKIDNTLEDVYSKMNTAIEEMKNNPKTARHANFLAQDLDKFENDVTTPKTAYGHEGAVQQPPSYADKFAAIDNLKRTLQGYSKYGMTAEDSAFGSITKGLAANLRPILEDQKIWGKAANIQKGINSAITEFLPTQKDIVSKFTSTVAGEKVIDPGKVHTYLGQLGKPAAEIKQEMVKNYLDKTSNLVNTINDVFTRQGLDAPLQHTSSTLLSDTIGEKTAGAKIIDTLIDRELHKTLGKTIGGSIGAGIGSIVGHGGLGFLAGEHALGPMISSVLPPLISPVKGSLTSVAGLKSAIDYAMAAVKGEKTMNKAVAAVFKPGAQVIGNKLSSQDRDRLEKTLDAHESNPNQMAQIDNGKLGHYLPGHQTELTKASAQALQYLQSIKPQPFKPGPLDKEIQPTAMQEARYNRALDIAQNPLMVLQHIKSGTLQPSDIKDLNSMYPAVYRQLVTKLSNEMINTHGDEKVVPYNSKLSLSLFLGQPIDASMNPMNIQASQIKTPIQQQSQQPQQKPKGSKSAPALQKGPKMYETPSQSSEAHKLEH